MNNPEPGYVGKKLDEPLSCVSLSPAITPLDGILLMNGIPRDIKIVDDAGGVRDTFLSLVKGTAARHTVHVAAKEAARQVIFEMISYLFL